MKRLRWILFSYFFCDIFGHRLKVFAIKPKTLPELRNDWVDNKKMYECNVCGGLSKFV